MEWESAVRRGAAVFRRLEEERLAQLAGQASGYLDLLHQHRPRLAALTERLREPVSRAEPARDLAVGLGALTGVCYTRLDVQSLNVDLDPEGDMGSQILPQFYAEDLLNVMNKERRREALSKFVGILKADIEREKKGRAGVENLAKALQETPKFGGEESQAEVADKLQHMRSMMTYLEASRFKALNVMMDVEGRARVGHPLSSYIDYSKVAAENIDGHSDEA